MSLTSNHPTETLAAEGLSTHPAGVAVPDDRTAVVLRRALPTVLLPGDPGYDAAVTPWNVAVAPHPVAVLEARGAQDVVAAVRVAGRLGLTVSVQATGHGATSGLSGGVLLVSTRRMTGLVVDATTRRARAEAGVTWEQVLQAGAPYGLAGLCGSAPGVGVVGYTTGGGLGPLVRTFGLASDRVRRFEVVTGDGELRTASASENPELFWGLRGGKGLLGIVTAVEFDLLPVAELYGGAVYFDGADAEAVLRRWATWSAGLPREATTSVALLRLPPLPSVPPPLAGRLTVAVRFAWTGPVAAGEAALAPMRAVAVPVVDTVAVMPYAALGAIHADPVDPMPTHEAHLLLDRFDGDGVAALLAVAGPAAPSRQIMVEVRQLGGAVGDVPGRSSAFDARGAGWSLMAIGLGAPPVVGEVAADADAVLAAMRPHALDVRLPNFAPQPGPAWLRATYRPATLRRLGRASAAYDPRGVVLGALDLPRPRGPRLLRGLLGR